MVPRQAVKKADSVAQEVEQLMADYPSIVNANKKLPKAKHHMKHVIETTCPHPLKAHYRRLDKDKLAAAEAEVLAMEQQGIVMHSKSSWASPGQHVAAMWRLPAAQPGHQARLVPATTH